MATITSRKRKDESIAYCANIRIKREGVIVHRECKTFDRHALAKAWAVRRELELQSVEAFGESKSVLISALIAQYIEQFGSKYGKSKNNDLKRILDYDIAQIDAYKLTAKQLITHCIERNKTAKPQTVQNDIVWLRTVMRTMRSVGGHEYDMSVFDAATDALRREKLIAKSSQRDRRPSRSELWRLSRYFARRYDNVPMLHLMWFAIYSARRDGEICELLWTDNDEQKKTGLVRNLKHPTRKMGNDKRFRYTKSAWKIVQRQPRTDTRIFPYNSRTVSAYFAKACKILEIDDLHFHDLRHEAVSRLFEAGLRIEQVQLISLHTSWETLRRYTNLRPEDLDI